MSKSEKPKTNRYILKTGTHRMHVDGVYKKFVPGCELYLTDEQALKLKNKVRPFHEGEAVDPKSKATVERDPRRKAKAAVEVEETDAVAIAKAKAAAAK